MSHHLKLRKIGFISLGAVLFLSLFFVIPLSPASGQCGSQASSCKNCHEVQGQDPVNNDGTGWHTGHAFGDFCYICHGGNNQAVDQVAAHEGMVAPLSDVQVACQQCHAADLMDRAQIYASALGVSIDAEASPSESTSSDAEPLGEESVSSAVSNQDCGQIVVDDPNVINYAQNYDEIVLGKKPINWGNTILAVMIGVVALGGGGFVAAREKLVRFSFGDTGQVEGEYSRDVLELLPQIASLKGKTRKSLRRILSRPDKLDKALELIETILDKESDEE